MKGLLSMMLSGFLTITGVKTPAYNNNVPEETSVVAIEEVVEVEEPKQEEKISYNRLHQLYLEINSDMSYEEVLTKVKQSGLPYYDKKYNGSRTIKVAFDEDVVPHKYAEEGEHLKIHFKDLNSDNRYEEYVFEEMSYWNSNYDNLMSLSVQTKYVWGYDEEEDVSYFINDYSQKSDSDRYIKLNNKKEQLQYMNVDIPNDIHQFEDVLVIEDDDETASQSPVNIPEDNSNNNNSDGNTTVDPSDKDEIVYWTRGDSYHKDSNCHNYVQAKYHYSGTMKECPKFDPCDDCCY